MNPQVWNELNALLTAMFREVNEGASPKSPTQIWQDHQYEITTLLNSVPTELFTQLNSEIWSPRAYEALRLLYDLRQRRERAAGLQSNRLVDQVRAETKTRERPVRNRAQADITGDGPRALAAIAEKPFYSDFQISGWRDVWNTIKQRDKSLIIVAPTGSGKTEVFLLPAIYRIAKSLERADVPHYVLIYPRVELLKDQISRVFRYAYKAEQSLQIGGLQQMFTRHKVVDHPFVVGLQYGGIRSTYSDTLDNRDIFAADRTFLTVPVCPICHTGSLRAGNASGAVIPLRCTSETCGAEFHVTIGKNDHAEARIKPHFLITTIESLDRLYLNPKLVEYVSNIDGLIFDEVHLYHALYGAHVHNVIARIDRLNEQTHGRPLFKIASSATVSSPERFASRLFYGVDQDDRVEVIDAKGYDSEPAGTETILFLQTTESNSFARTQSTLIQTVMAVGHGVLLPDDRILVFTESIDHADRSFRQIRDSEQSDQLWHFRTVVEDVLFEGFSCPASNPGECQHLYLQGECWRGIKGGTTCYIPQASISENPLSLGVIHSKNRDQADYWGPNVIIATPVLEVGVDDERFRATIHYRPPRSVFSFLQRRGRAGRSGRDNAYSILVLGRTAADEFYFRRRNRLMSAGEYELPLNPNNEVIRQMHLRIELERNEIIDQIGQGIGIPKTILMWTMRKYLQCPTLNRLFGSQSNDDFFTSISERARTSDNTQVQTRQEEFKTWIRLQRDRFQRHLELDILLAELVSRAPEAVRMDVIRFRELIHSWRNQVDRDYSEINQLALQLNGVLERLAIDAEDTNNQLEADMFRSLQQRVREIRRDQSQIGVIRAEPELISSLYDFFNLLHTRINEERYKGTLNRTDDMIKIVLQSLFYVGGYCIEHTAGGCPSCMEYFVPDAYFQEVKPITVETWTNTGRKLEELYVEDTTKLATMLLPYKTFYRYFSERDYMAVVRTTTQSNWVHRSGLSVEVHLELHVEGIRRDGGIYPTKIHVVPIRPDRDGQGIVKLCLNCFRLYGEDYNSRTACNCDNGQIVPVRMRSEPIIVRDARYSTAQRISDTFSYCDNLVGIIRILGANVEYAEQIERPSVGYVPNNRRGNFRSLYYRTGETPQPIVYELRTHGIIWDLRQMVTSLLREKSLKKQLDRYPNKVLNAELILHTAAHMLHKAIASLSGVNDVTLEYAILPEQMHVVVWERIEGGVGISEIIRDILLEDPKRLYRELLSTILCPVHYSEDAHWTGSDESLRRHVSERWALADEEDMRLVDAFVHETVAERQAVRVGRAEPDTACSITDGCPACIHVTVCSNHLEQADTVSHCVAEAIMEYFRLRIDNTQLNTMNGFRIDQGIGLVVRLRDDLEQDRFDVVRF